MTTIRSALRRCSTTRVGACSAGGALRKRVRAARWAVVLTVASARACSDPTTPEQGSFGAERGPNPDATSSAATSSTSTSATAGTSRDTNSAPTSTGRSSNPISATPTQTPVNPGRGKKVVGNITTRGQVESDFANLWNPITPGNESKSGSVKAVKGQLNWGPVDATTHSNTTSRSSSTRSFGVANRPIG